MSGIITLWNKFTLIEVLIAAGISVIVLGIISGAAWSTFESIAATDRRLDLTAENTALIRRLTEDLKGAQYDVIRSAAKIEEYQDSDEVLPPIFLAEEEAAGFVLKIYTTGAVTGPNRPAGVYRVDYRFDDSEGKLERRQANIAQVELELLPWRIVAEDLRSFDMLFYDGEEWEEFWDSNEEKALPLAIELDYTFERNGLTLSYDFTVSTKGF